MQKSQQYRTPSRLSPSKSRVYQSQNLSQSQKLNSHNNSNFMSKSLAFAHSSFPLKCQNQSHNHADIHSICLKEECDKPYRLACLKCLNGHHKDHTQHMLKIQDFLNHENKDTLPFEVPNWPINNIGQQIKQYIESEEKYIQDLYDGVDNYFNDFLEKVQQEVNKIKQSMNSDIASFYKKGPGKKKIDFINQLKCQFIESYDLTELQVSIKDSINRGLQQDIFDNRVEYFLNSHTNIEKRNHTNNFFLSNQQECRFELDFQHLHELQKQVTDGIQKCRKISNNQQKFDMPKTFASENIPWNDTFHALLGYLNKQYKHLNERDIIQYKQEVYADSSRYEGFFVNGYRDIIGSRFYTDGNIYLGEWSQGLKTGNGLFYYYKGNIYQGGFHNDRREGFGKELYTSGAKFEGVFSNDLKHGNGKYTFPDGKVFEGFYQFDKRDGPGIYTYPNGKIEDVYYQNGTRVVENQQQPSVMDNEQNVQSPNLEQAIIIQSQKQQSPSKSKQLQNGYHHN